MKIGVIALCSSYVLCLVVIRVQTQRHDRKGNEVIKWRKKGYWDPSSRVRVRTGRRAVKKRWGMDASG